MGRHASGGGEKDFVLRIIRSPDSDDGVPPIQITTTQSSSTSSKKPKSSSATTAGFGAGQTTLSLDQEWITEHATQASRILPGGLDIIGIYVLCDDKAFQAGAGAISATLKSISIEIESDSPLLVAHVDSVTAKISARELSSNSPTLKPCDVKVSAVVPQMATVNCQYQLQLHVYFSSGKQLVYDAVKEAIFWNARNKVGPAVAATAVASDGVTGGGAATTLKFADPSAQIADILSSTSDSNASSPTVLEIELLSPVGVFPGALTAMGAAPPTANGQGTYHLAGTCILAGTLHCRAYVHKRETLGAAVSAIKADITRSLLARFALLAEAAELATSAVEAQFRGQVEEAAKKGVAPPKGPPRKHPLTARAGELAKEYGPSLPRRAFFGWADSGGVGGSGGGSYCDYLVDGEGPGEAFQRIEELMGAGVVEQGSFLCFEAVPASSPDQNAGRTKNKSSGSSSLECSAAMVGSVVAVVMAVVMYYTTIAQS